jgi:hypothetical protein
MAALPSVKAAELETIQRIAESDGMHLYSC